MASSDFPVLPGGDDGSTARSHVALTYYYLYPMRDLPPDPMRHAGSRASGRRSRCSSRATPGSIGASGRPTSFVFHEPPEFVVISKGIEPPDVDPLASTRTRCAGGPTSRSRARASRHLRHRGYPPSLVRSAARDALESECESAAGRGGARVDPAEFPGVETLLLWAAVGGPAPGRPVAGAAVLAAMLALALLFMLAWLITSSGMPSTSRPVTRFRRTRPDEANGDGGQAGSTDEPPAGGGSGPDPTTAAGSRTRDRRPDETSSRSTSARRHAQRGRRTHRIPVGLFCEHPYWWEYTAAWGVNVTPAWTTTGRVALARRRATAIVGLLERAPARDVAQHGSAGP